MQQLSKVAQQQRSGGAVERGFTVAQKRLRVLCSCAGTNDHPVGRPFGREGRTGFFQGGFLLVFSRWKSLLRGTDG